jgi:hypothetical protein
MEKRSVGSFWQEFIFSALLILGGAAFIFFSGWDDWWRLKERGVVVTAGVLKMEVEYRETRTSSSVGFAHHHVLARFLEAGEGSPWHDVEYEVSGRHYKRLQGMEVPRLEVVYDRQDPNLSAPQEELPGSVMAVLFGTALILFGAWYAYTCWHDAVYGLPETTVPLDLPSNKFIVWLEKLIDRSSEFFRKDR